VTLSRTTAAGCERVLSALVDDVSVVSRPIGLSRICSAGHGGQVLVSAAAYDSLGGAVLTGLTFRHLGEHSLKDLREPERLFQLLIAGVHNAWSRCCAARQTSSPRP
jgi:class 3 adenylate cyclase